MKRGKKELIIEAAESLFIKKVMSRQKWKT